MHTFHTIKFYDMTKAEIKYLTKHMPESSRQVVTFGLELFGDDVPYIFKDKWREEGGEEVTKVFTTKILQKFPEWSDVEVAEFIGVTEDYVNQLRSDWTKQNKPAMPILNIFYTIV